MNKMIFAVVALIIIAAAAIGFAMANNDKDEVPATDTSNTSEQPTNETTPTSSEFNIVETNVVTIENMVFSPVVITVKKGTTVIWTNQDSVQHDITPTNGPEDFKASELLSKGESYSFTFNNADTYEYKCSLHPQMTATVIVTE